MKTMQKFTEAIASTSTGRYYQTIAEWWLCIETVCRAFDVTVTDYCPPVFTNEGRATVNINDDIRIFMTWYRMPSFNWEIICYCL